MASSSVPSSSRPRDTYDVFLSFRGEDTRDNFVSHLYTALTHKGIRTFKDDEKLERGKSISPELRRAIGGSRFSIIVLSKNYASSRWCLDELVEAVECSNTTVCPIFYHVHPSEVRGQRGSFRKGFDDLVSKQGVLGMENVQRWRNALEQVANLSGWAYPSDAIVRSESIFIQEVVGILFRKLIDTYSSIGKDLVGMVSRTEKVIELLGLGMDDARVVGIWGMGGIGKTTISRAVYDCISCQFEGYSFIENVREVSEKCGLKTLQEQLISEILMEKDLNVKSDGHAVHMIRNMVCHKKVLIVLDDVDESTKLEKLVGEHDWYSFGSRIIVTTRNQHALTRYGIKHIYEVEHLREDEAIELLESKAFGKHRQMGGYGELVRHAVKYANGVPLALKVLGSFLCGRNKDEWESSLNRLKKSPLKEVLQVLRISYDALESEEKDIFLDIACFFKGKDKNDVTKILESCGFHPIIGIDVLVQKSLITVSGNKLLMHDLIQELGWHIVCEESHKEPGKRTRLWCDEDIKHVLMDNTGTNKVEGIVMQYSDLRGLDPKDIQFPKQLKLRPKAFAKMSNLRILKICCMHLSEELKYLPNKLRYLDWLGYPMKYMPSTFQPEHLVELHLTYSSIEQLWEGTMHLGKLRIMNLSHSTYLTKSPDFIGVPNLERLILEGCTGLVNLHPSIVVVKRLICLNLKDCKSLKSLPCGIQLESLEVFIVSGCSKLDNVLISLEYMKCLSKLCLDGIGISEHPPSVGHLTNLGLISLSDCKNLKSIPDSICQLKDLRTLILSGCSKLDKLPPDLGVLYCLYELRADWTAIRQLSSSIGRLKKLEILTLRGCKGISSNSMASELVAALSGLESLRKLDLSFCNLNSMASELAAALSGLESLRHLNLGYCNLKSIPTAICSIYSLEFLSLRGNNMKSLPASMNQLSSLFGLHLDDCKKLQELPEISPKIDFVVADDCPSLRTIWTPSETFCDPIVSFNNSFKLVENKQNDILTEKFLSNIFQRNFRKGYCDFVLPGREIPKWFSHQSRGSATSFQLPPHWFNDRFLGFAYAVVGFKEAKSDYCRIEMDFKCHVTQRIVEEGGNHRPYVKFGNMVVRCIPRSAFSGITEGDMEQLNEGGFECKAYSYEPIRLSSIGEDENLEEKVCMSVYKVEFEKVGVHLVYREAEEQAEEHATTSKRKRNLDLDDNYYDAAAAGPSGSPRIDDQEDHLNNLNGKRLRMDTSHVLPTDGEDAWLPAIEPKSNKRKGRVSTTLPDVIKDRSYGVRKAIDYNENGQLIGNNSIECSSYHGVLARTMVPICYKDWFEVPSELKEKLWCCVELTYKVDERSKKKVLSSICSKWRTFKKELTKYIRENKSNPEIISNPPAIYGFIEQRHWDSFLEGRLSEEFEILSQVQKWRRSQNKYNHRISRKGYARFQEDYDELTKQKSDGSLKTEGCNDILTMALGTLESSSRVRGVGNSVTRSTYFHLPRRGNQSYWEKKCNDLEAVVVQLQARLSAVEQQIPHTRKSEHVSSNALRSGYEGNFQHDFLSTENRVRTKDDIPTQALTQKFIKGKCSNTLKSGGRGNFQDDSILPENRVRSKDDIPPQNPKQNKRKGKPCKLAVGSIENIVAHGTVYERIEPNEAIHTVPLGESNVRVSIEVVIQKDAPLPIPISDEMLIVGEAVGFFVAWPKNLVLVGDEGVSINVECGKYQESIQSFVSLVEHIKYDEAIDIPLEKDIFGVEINIQLQKVDMEYICHVKELSVTCIMLYISHLHQVLKVSNWRKQFVFVNPCIVSGKTMDGEESKSVLLARRLEEAMLEQLILIPYNIGYHWILLVIDLTLMIVYLLDPINSKINTSLEIVINTALKIYETTQRRRRTNPVWKVVQSPQQPTNVECGFYVMRYMKDLIRDQSILRKQNFNGKKTYTETELDEVRVEWINFVLKNMS